MSGNSLVKAVMNKYQLPEKMVRKMLLPELNEEFFLRGLVYRVVYLNESKCGFSAIPIRTALPASAKRKIWMLSGIQKLRKLLRRS